MKEIWKDVVGYEGRYQVSNLGRVRSFVKNLGIYGRVSTLPPGGRILKAFDRGNGYLAVNLYWGKKKFKTISVHRIVAHAFLGTPPNGYHVNHIDMNRGNNRIDNLEYLSSRDNQMHSRKFKHWTNGLKGETHPRASLKKTQVLEIRQLHKTGNVSIRKIAKQYNTTYFTIYDIVNYRSWKHLP